jgi:hypothetical protein
VFQVYKNTQYMKKFLKNIVKLKEISTIKDFRFGTFPVRVTLFCFHFVSFRFSVYLYPLQNSFFFSFDIVFLLYRFRRIFSLDFVFLLYRFRWISFSYFTDFVSFRWISFSYFTDFVGFCFRFVSFRFFSFLSLPVPQWNAMLRKTPTLKRARSSPRNSVFIGHA